MVSALLLQLRWQVLFQFLLLENVQNIGIPLLISRRLFLEEVVSFGRASQEHSFCCLEDEMVFGDWEENDSGEDHNNFEDTSQIAEEINGPIDSSVVSLLQRFKINVSHQNCIFGVGSILPIFRQTQQRIAVVKGGRVAGGTVANGEPADFGLGSDLSQLQ